MILYPVLTKAEIIRSPKRDRIAVSPHVGARRTVLIPELFPESFVSFLKASYLAFIVSRYVIPVR